MKDGGGPKEISTSIIIATKIFMHFDHKKKTYERQTSTTDLMESNFEIAVVAAITSVQRSSHFEYLPCSLKCSASDRHYCLNEQRKYTT